MLFKRKIYDKLIEWKKDGAGEKALLIEGARRIGKSTIVEEFAKREAKSYLLIEKSCGKRRDRLRSRLYGDPSLIIEPWQYKYKK